MNKKNLIIIEGPDLAGKTTFINRFSDEKFLKYHFGVGEKIDTALDFYKQVEKVLLNLYVESAKTNRDVILDRSWISDKHYVHVRQDGGRTNQLFNCAYNGLCDALFDKIVTVVLLPPFELIEERYKKDGDDFLSLEQLKDAYKSYEDMLYAIDYANVGPHMWYLMNYYGIPVSNTAHIITMNKDVAYDSIFNSILKINN